MFFQGHLPFRPLVRRLASRIAYYPETRRVRPVAATLLANENGTFSLEVPRSTPGATYYVKVSALYPQGRHSTGNYFLGVDYGTQPVTSVQSYADGTLASSTTQVTQTLSVGKNRLAQYILSADAGPAWSQVKMEILDTAGRVVFTLSAYAGQAPWDIGKPQQGFVDVAERVTGSVLDAGCGTGDTALFLAERGCQVTGIDFIEEPIRRAQRKAAERGLQVTFLVKDALALKEWSERFDNVIDSGLFHVFS